MVMRTKRRFMDGATLSGIGTLCLGIAALATLAIGLLNRKRVADFFTSKIVIIGERDEAINLAKREQAIRLAAQQSAESWEDAARGAMFDADAMQRRLEIVEKRMSTAQQQSDGLREDLNRLRDRVQVSDELVSEVISYTRVLLEWSVKAETVSQLGGVHLSPIPEIPPALADRLQIPSQPNLTPHE